MTNVHNGESYRGACLCGAIKYDLLNKPLFSVVCHCKDCQKQSGSAFSCNLICRKEDITLRGDLSIYEGRSDKGDPVFRKFCGKCGSPILSELSAFPDIIALKVGSLEDTSVVMPTSQVWCDSRQNWVDLELEGPSFSKGRTK